MTKKGKDAIDVVAAVDVAFNFGETIASTTLHAKKLEQAETHVGLKTFWIQLNLNRRWHFQIAPANFPTN